MLEQGAESESSVTRASTRAKRPTMADVAARVGVSRALVSLVFRNEPGASKETRDRVFRAADELGYRPDNAARLLARNRSMVLGVMINIRNAFHADLVEAIYAEAERLGYEVLLSALGPTRDERKVVEALLGHRCEALILLGPNAETPYLAELGAHTPTVVVGRRVPASGVDTVHTAENKGMRQAMDHLVGLGHRAIVHIDGGNGPGSAERRRAYRAAMCDHGLQEEIRVLAGDHTEESGEKAGETLVHDDRLPTAVLAGNDRCAMGLMHALSRAGVSIPTDISVVGYDDSHIAHLSHINLTTVRQDAEQMAQLAVRSAVERLDDHRLPSRELILDARLVVRGTTAPPRA
ncbi:LacI family DNA-binding transcriptional regulator [Nonomuraea basaltis]|uniref:LacI family DNA-binding transcriptional regulator n=1 Tax=Nonomuraea basaltis TaxID=2495887 RepID=UPI00110C6464|nr:LacI family DNA-binding transcriptional regulator [Nonomuraea basaltis]TMR94134.1 LacI family transcriptional regulator [Nonomuraea basaltis]